MSRKLTLPFCILVLATSLSGAALAQQDGGRGGGDRGGGSSGGSTPSDILSVHLRDQTQRELAMAFRERMGGRVCLTHVCTAPPPNRRVREPLRRVQLTSACTDNVITRHQGIGQGAATYVCGRTAVR
jgi:hypothetical protein